MLLSCMDMSAESKKSKTQKEMTGNICEDCVVLRLSCRLREDLSAMKILEGGMGHAYRTNLSRPAIVKSPSRAYGGGRKCCKVCLFVVQCAQPRR